MIASVTGVDTKYSFYQHVFGIRLGGWHPSPKSRCPRLSRGTVQQRSSRWKHNHKSAADPCRDVERDPVLEGLAEADQRYPHRARHQ